MRRLIFSALLSLSVALVVFAGAPAIEAGGGGYGGCSTPPRDGAGQHITIVGNCYSPAVLYVQPGESVTWANEDDYGHNVMTFDGELLGDQEPFFQGNQSGLMNGDLLTYTFESPGLYPYYCSIHPSMLGVVVVGSPASPEFGANLTVQTAAGPQTPAGTGEPAAMKGSGPGGGVRWAEALLGAGLAGGLLFGLVAAGGGLRLWRRRA